MPGSRGPHPLPLQPAPSQGDLGKVPLLTPATRPQRRGFYAARWVRLLPEFCLAWGLGSEVGVCVCVCVCVCVL